MTTAEATKTVAPEAGTAQHGLKAHSDGDWANRVPVQTRSERPTSTDVADFAEVTGREAVWKYTPVAKLDALLNGELDGSRIPVTVPPSRGWHLSGSPETTHVSVAPVSPRSAERLRPGLRLARLTS